MQARDTAYFESMPSAYAADVFINLVLINVAINFGYEYFCSVIYFWNIFFVKTFLQHFFFNIFSKIFSQDFFSKIFS